MTRESAAPRRRILFVSWNFPPRRGGVEQMVQRLFENLGRAADVTLLTGSGGGAVPRVDGVFRSPLPGLVGYLIWLLWRLPRALWAGKFEVVLSSGAFIGSLVELAARMASRPHAVLVYGTDLTYPSALYQRWISSRLASVPMILAISSAVEAEARRRGLGTRGRIARLSPGVDVAMAAAPYSPELRQPARPVLLFVGRVIERKGLEPFLVHCLPLILERCPVEVWVVGGEAADSLAHRPGTLARLRERLAGSPSSAHVRFLGTVSDETLRAAYRCAKVLVLPAIAVPGDMEGFGIVFLEAALFGVPAVSTRLGGIPDAVIDGETGALVEPGDWPAFAAAVGRLLNDEALYGQVSERARRRAAGDYDWACVSDRCLRLLEATHRA